MRNEIGNGQTRAHGAGARQFSVRRADAENRDCAGRDIRRKDGARIAGRSRDVSKKREGRAVRVEVRAFNIQATSACRESRTERGRSGSQTLKPEAHLYSSSSGWTLDNPFLHAAGIHQKKTPRFARRL
jgi:hypothetical protein